MSEHINASGLTETDLHAYADNQLAPQRALLLEAALACDEALAARLEEIRTQNAALRAVFDPLLAEPIPERLLKAATQPSNSEPEVAKAKASRPAGSWLLPSLAAAATLVAGIAIGWFVRDATIAPATATTAAPFIRQVAFAHSLYAADARRPVEVWANEEKSLVNWLTKRLGFAVRAPDLNSIGYALVGGRLVAGNDKPVALFMYENAEKQRLSLQVLKQGDGGETAFRYAVENGVGVFYWVEGGAGYALAGNLDRTQLLPAARVVYEQLTASAASAAK